MTFLFNLWPVSGNKFVFYYVTYSIHVDIGGYFWWCGERAVVMHQSCNHCPPPTGRAGTSTQGSGWVDQLPGYKFTTRYPNANYRMYK